MDWFDDVLSTLATAETWGYHANSPCATEPAALTALALLAHGRGAAALPILEWLCATQSAEGRVGVEVTQSEPGWATSWCAVAWRVGADRLAKSEFRAAADRACAWVLTIKGSQIEFIDKRGHDTTIIGWPWVKALTRGSSRRP